MIPGLHPVIQTLLGTALTWGVTALGAAFCILDSTSIDSNRLLTVSLGFSGGVMLSASFWSLLAPAKDICMEQGYGSWSFLPLTIGFVVGCAFVYLSDRFLPVEKYLLLNTEKQPESTKHCDPQFIQLQLEEDIVENNISVRKRRDNRVESPSNGDSIPQKPSFSPNQLLRSRHMAMMIVAITLHNIPEGMAVGVGFGAKGASQAASFASARSLAIGIAIQNFPEGLAVSLPLKASGMSFGQSLWYGQLSGAVEPIAALFGCLAVQVITPLLPYALAFAAGAMIFVVFDDIMPELHNGSENKEGTLYLFVGFVVMMIMDVALS